MKKYIMPNMRVADMDVNNLFATSDEPQILSGEDITEGESVQGDARTTSLWDQEW